MYFTVRHDLVQIYNGSDSYRSNLSIFSEFSGFTLGLNIGVIDYYPGVLHEVTSINGEKSSLDLINPEYDGYISNISIYNAQLVILQQQLEQSLLPQTLLEAKQQIISDIYDYSTSLSDETVRLYPSSERNKWASVILPEAKAYLATKDPDNAPNLVQQEILRISITDVNSTAFKASLTNRILGILQRDADTQKAINHYVGIRGRWVDYVNNFAIQTGETEQEAISRLLTLDWRIGWEVPN